MSGSSTVIRHGIEVMQFKGTDKSLCDICGLQPKAEDDIDFYLWDSVDVPSVWESDSGNYFNMSTVLALCEACDETEIEKVKKMDEDITSDASSTGAKTGPTYQTNGWTDSNGVFHPYGAAGKSTNTWTEKCKKGGTHRCCPSSRWFGR